MGASELIISDLINVGNATYSAMSLPGGGVSFINGVVTLKQTGRAIDFDDRYNGLWNRGNKILFKYEDPNPSLGQVVTQSYYPIIGTTYIISSQYDMKSTLNLTVGCILALLNKLTPQDLGICIEVGSELAISEVAKTLLEAAGIPTAIIDDASFDALLATPKIVEPVSVPIGSSIIQYVARLVGQHGVFIAQDLNGFVKAYLWSDLANKAGIFSKRARDLHTYRRRGARDSRLKTYIASYNVAQVCEEADFQRQTSRTGDQLVVTDITRNDTIRTIQKEIREFVTVAGEDILRSKTLETSFYEQEPAESEAVTRIGQADGILSCFPEDRARLLTRVTETRIDNTEYIEAWLATKDHASQNTGTGYPSTQSSPSGLTGDIDFSLFGYNVVQEVTETWNYVSETEILFTREEFTPIAVAVPIWGDQGAGIDTANDARFGVGGIYEFTPVGEVITDLPPEQNIKNRLRRETYTKSSNVCEGWKVTKEQYETNFARDPASLVAEVKDATKVIQDVYDKSYTLVLTQVETENNAGEPSPDTYPPKNTIASDDFEFIIGEDPENPLTAQAFPLDVVQRQFLGTYFNFPVAQIQKIAAASMDFNNGRTLGMVMADSVHEVDMECWEDIVPFFLSKIIEPYRKSTIDSDVNIASIYSADTPTITISPSETVLGWLGVFRGQQDDPVVIRNLSNFSADKSQTNLPVSTVGAQSIPPLALQVDYDVDQDASI